MKMWLLLECAGCGTYQHWLALLNEARQQPAWVLLQHILMPPQGTVETWMLLEYADRGNHQHQCGGRTARQSPPLTALLEVLLPPQGTLETAGDCWNAELAHSISAVSTCCAALVVLPPQGTVETWMLLEYADRGNNQHKHNLLLSGQNNIFRRGRALSRRGCCWSMRTAATWRRPSRRSASSGAPTGASWTWCGLRTIANVLLNKPARHVP